MKNLDEILNNKQLVSEEKFEEKSSAQDCATPIIMNILRDLGDELPDELVLDFFFNTDDRSKADSLSEVLREFGYDVQITEEAKGKLPFSITGQSIPMPNEDAVIVNWTKKMNELGYIHDCEFDGWGTAVMKGGWFSDDASDEQIRKRMGLPPREEDEIEEG